MVAGSNFIRSIDGVAGDGRERAILDAIDEGSVPSWTNLYQPVAVSGFLGETMHEGTIFASVDVVGVGENSDWCRMPMWQSTAQTVCDAFDALMPTPRMSDAIWRASTKLTPLPQTWNNDHPPTGTESRRYLDHHRAIERQLSAHFGGPSPRSALVAGHKKDLVLNTDAAHIAIYGWHQLSGRPIQPFSPKAHDARYVDYSHGLRLIRKDMLLDGERVDVADVLADPKLSALISFGPIRARYSGAPSSGEGGGGKGSGAGQGGASVGIGTVAAIAGVAGVVGLGGLWLLDAIPRRF